MIVPMQKVAVLCLNAQRNQALESLRQLGVLHLNLDRRVEHADIESAQRRLECIRQACDALPAKTPQAPSTTLTADGIVDDLSRLIQLRRENQEELLRLRQERQRIEPFGAFAPETIAALAERGIFIRLFQASPKKFPAIPEQAAYLETLRTGSAVFFAVVTRGEQPGIEAQLVPPPAVSLTVIESRISELEVAQAQIADQVARFGGDRAALVRLRTEAEEILQLAGVRASMGAATSRIDYLQGFCPTDDVDRIRHAARENGWGLWIEDPAETDRVPTLLRNPVWMKPIEAIYDLIGILPGYREIDVSLSFLLFFTLFFAMLVGDAGYGTLFLILSVWARRKFPDVPAHVFGLLTITSVATVVWGVLTGTYFGIPNLPAPLASLKLNWLGNEDHVKELCFWIAAMHLSIAHIWNMIKLIRTPLALAQLGWLCVVWFMFFTALSVVLNQPFPEIMNWVFLVGVALIVLFMTPRKELRESWFNHVMLPLNLVGGFVDIISYIRLYAVGVAGFAIASAFNTMLTPLFDNWLTGLLAALLLFVAHAVNITLAVMGVMVHGIRLNTLEFAGHIGLQWSGIPYLPWRRKLPAAT